MCLVACISEDQEFLAVLLSNRSCDSTSRRWFRRDDLDVNATGFSHGNVFRTLAQPKAGNSSLVMNGSGHTYYLEHVPVVRWTHQSGSNPGDYVSKLLAA